jgi:hypothetical protein
MLKNKSFPGFAEFLRLVLTLKRVFWLISVGFVGIMGSTSTPVPIPAA